MRARLAGEGPSSPLGCITGAAEEGRMKSVICMSGAAANTGRAGCDPGRAPTRMLYISCGSCISPSVADRVRFMD